MALIFALVGALSFWLPDMAVHIAAGRNFGGRHVWVLTFLLPTTFLFAYMAARRFASKRDFKWAGPAMLLGVWLTGGVFMTVAITALGEGFTGAEGFRSSLSMILFSMIPPVTYVMATYDGSLFALLAVTIGGLLMWGVQKRDKLFKPCTQDD